MKVLLTGGRGFVGRRLIPGLLEQGHTVRLLLRPPAEDVPGCEVVPGDLTRPDTLREAVRGIDCIVHSAALMSEQEHRPWSEFVAHNVAGTRDLLAAGRAEGEPFFVHLSTALVTGPSSAFPADEEAPLSPGVSRYARSKALAEKEAAASGLPYVILRLPPLYGPGMRYGWPQVMGMIRSGTFRILGPAKGLMHLTHIDDVVDGVLAALRKGRALPQRVYVLAGPKPIPIGEAFALLARGLGRPHPGRIPYPVALAAAYALNPIPAFLKPGVLRLLLPHRVRYFSENYVYNSTQAALDFGFAPSVAPEEGLAAMAADYQRSLG
jgi:nucleoside-diphosphate-sugar epimerase